MQIQFHGAAGGVTGCCHLLRTARASVLLDFGLHQGGPASERLNRRPPAFDARRLDAVVLSHAHIDHCGRLPLLPRLGSRAPVWCTPATAELCAIMLPDSAHLQQHDAERWNRRRADRRSAPPRARPLYDQDDVQRALRQFRTLPYPRPVEIADGVRLSFRDAGHILGSAIVVLDVEEVGRTRRVVFSGDVGNWPAPLLRDPEPIDGADVLLLESTYGNRDHRTRDDTVAELSRVLSLARDSGGKVLVPAFAVGRTQELLWHLGELQRDGRLGLPVFVDSPMAVSATELYRRHLDLFDAEARKLVESGDAPLDFPGLRLCRSVDESVGLNARQGPAVIMAASGMCTGGRIVHHLRHHGGQRSTQVVIVGFQAAGTPGRALVDGARSLVLLGERVPIDARVHTLGGFSAHADQSRLVRWTANFRTLRPRAFLIHGEDDARHALAARLRSELGLDVGCPQVGDAAEV
ncbi:MAG: MBL fold metallo-hydrolase [Planctomycetes bacterium]|nr:MBL fold metallo-hydrolase [Planctomycetota bacterium]